ncbi:carbohydrate kinase family protein [Agromyces sp. NPDC056523]|uniref:carbohydrate kinase family protein n=1 Tax=Agromyces sp. NPDC056523 TaxID=3345850 RepID=UPI00366B35DD
MSSPAEAAEPAGPAERAGHRTPGVLVVVGDLLEDIVVWATEPIRAATDSAAQVFRSRGGSAANVAAHAATLAPTRFIGRVGDDGAGRALESALAATGVDVRVQRAGRSGAVVLIVAPDGERTMFPDRAAAAELEDVDPGWLDGVDWVHVPSYGLEHEPMRGEVRRLVALARERGATVSVDASSTGLLETLGVERALGWIAGLRPDVLFANETEATLLGVASGGGIAASVARRVVVKHGPEPTEVFDDGRLDVRVPVAPVASVRDLTGAGDAFAAGYVAAALAGADATGCCLAGHRLAASVIASPGGDVNGG